MTTEEDRKAFEAWYVLRCKAKSPPPRHGNDYVHSDPTLTWHGWQAALEHCAPKLTEAGAIENAARALAEIDCRAQAELRKVFDEPSEGEASCVSNSWPLYVHEAKAALRAAGMRFKDEA